MKASHPATPMVASSGDARSMPLHPHPLLASIAPPSASNHLSALHAQAAPQLQAWITRTEKKGNAQFELSASLD